MAEAFGGVAGVRDRGLLESALSQPAQTFDGTDLYPTVVDKAARLAFGIVRNHPFVDGNQFKECFHSSKALLSVCVIYSQR
jgi:death-on-curing protein